MPLATTADNGTIILDGVAFKVVVGDNGKGADLLQVQQLGSYQQGVTIGSPDVNSHPYLSTWGLMDLTGGHGLADHLAGTTDTRYRYSTLDVSRPGQWAGRWKVNTETGTAGAFMPLGDLLYSGNVEMYGAFGTDLHIWNESTDAWTDTTVNLTAAAVNPGVAFAGTGTLRLFIPLGASGYDTYTGAAKANVASDALMFCVFGGSNLIRLTTTGQLHYSTDGTAWTSYNADGKIDGALTAYGIHEWRDAMDNPILIIHTSGGAFTFDPAGPTLYPLDLKFPNHPNQGLAACVWRGIYYVTVGMGIHSYTGSVIGAMGLDRDEGLPALYSLGSRIVALAPEYNNMYALVQGGSSAYPSVQRFDGYGWHSVWEASGTGTASKLFISGARSTPRIWWGVGNNSYTTELPIAYSNPRQLIVASSSDFLEASGYLETGMTNMGMPGSRKVAVSLGVRLDVPDELILLADPLTLKFRTSENATWTALSGPYNENGLGPIIPDGTISETLYYWFDADFEGVAFDEIELRVENTYANLLPIKYAAMYFMKVLSGNLAWNAAFDCTNTVELKTDAALAAKLDSLITSGRIVSMIHRDTTYKVRVSAWNGSDATGRADARSTRTVSLIQIRDRP